MFSAQTLQSTHLNTDQVGVEDAHQDVGSAGGVGQGAEDVENRLHTQLFADGGDVFHGGVVIRGKHET